VYVEIQTAMEHGLRYNPNVLFVYRLLIDAYPADSNYSDLSIFLYIIDTRVDIHIALQHVS